VHVKKQNTGKGGNAKADPHPDRGTANPWGEAERKNNGTSWVNKSYDDAELAIAGVGERRGAHKTKARMRARGSAGGNWYKRHAFSHVWNGAGKKGDEKGTF